MADEKKPDQNLDDWDSLPLDPSDDDWDDIPPLAPAPEADAAERSFEARLGDEMNLSGDLPELDDSLPELDDEDPPAEEDDFDQLPDIPLEAFTGPAPAAPSAPAAPPPDEADEPQDDDGLSAQLGAMGIDEAFSALEESRKETDPIQEREPEADIPATTKVELDIEGIFLDDVEGPKETPPAELIPEEPPPVQAAEPEPPASAPEEPPAKRKRPRAKLLLVAGGVLLVLGGAGFGVYKLFFAGPEIDESQAVLAIDPSVPPREPVPGDLELPPFYINFSGPQGETIVEMTVTLHYPDLTDRLILEQSMPTVRDIIARAAKDQGGQVVTSAELQRGLRQAAADQVNGTLGGPHLAYVQISQIRVLH